MSKKDKAALNDKLLGDVTDATHTLSMVSTAASTNHEKSRIESSTQAVKKYYRPFKRGALKQPWKKARIGAFFSIAISPVDEHLMCAGADPDAQHGVSFWQQVRAGPYSWPMFYSCIAFMIPAVIHLLFFVKHREHKDNAWPFGGLRVEHLHDLLAGLALIAVGISSPLCDAFCVWSAVYDDGNPDSESGMKYEKAAAALHCKPCEVEQEIEKWQFDVDTSEFHSIESAQSEPILSRDASVESVGLKCASTASLGLKRICAKEIWAPDRWNNLTRLIDRFVCVALVVPTQLYFVAVQRPWWTFKVDAAIVAAIFFCAMGTCVTGQHYRTMHPCGVRKVQCDRGLKVVIEKGYEMYMLFHQVWHLLLVLGLSGSAFYRPDFDLPQDKNPFWEGLLGGILFGLTFGVSGMAIAMRYLHIYDVNMVSHFNDHEIVLVPRD